MAIAMERASPGKHPDKAPLQVAYVLAYRAPNYIRTVTLLQALKSSPELHVLVARNSHRGLLRYVDTWVKLMRIRRRCRPDVYILGFRGHEFFWPVRFLTRGRPLIFDALMSPYASLGQEKRGNILRRCLASVVFPLERSVLNHADLVLTDTELHVDFYERVFGIPPTRVAALPVGAIERVSDHNAPGRPQSEVFSVLFYGSFLPLHGIETIIRAAETLTDLPIRFDFVGGSMRHARRLRQSCAARGVKNYTHRRWVPLEQLLQVDIPRADLCLGGPFGGTPQARRVVTGKTSQCLALGKATVVGRIDEEHGFVDQVNCLLVEQADPASVATSIRWAYEHRAMLETIGANGKQLYDDQLSVCVVSRRLVPLIRDLAERVAAP